MRSPSNAGSPSTMARYSLWVLRSWNWVASAKCAALRLGDDHDARGVAVEAVDDAGALRAADVGELVDVERERVRERPVAPPAPRVDDEAGGLVEDQHRGVLVEDVERDLLRA